MFSSNALKYCDNLANYERPGLSGFVFECFEVFLAFWQTLSAQDCHALFECIGEFAEIWQTLGALDRRFSNVLESLDVLPEVSGQIELMPEKACKSAAARCLPRAQMATRTYRPP